MVRPIQILDGLVWIAIPVLHFFTTAGRRIYREYRGLALLISSAFAFAAIHHFVDAFR
jgi:hypothetical protein